MFWQAVRSGTQLLCNREAAQQLGEKQPAHPLSLHPSGPRALLHCRHMPPRTLRQQPQ